MRVLVADSSIVRLDIAQSYLWQHGHEAEIACTGLECWTALEDFQPDLLVLDADVLCVAGNDVRARLDITLALRSVPIILLIGPQQRRHNDLPVFDGRHVVKRLTKPVGLRELLAAVEAHGRFAQADVPPLKLYAM